MLKWMGFAAKLFAVVLMLGFYTAAMATMDVNDPNKCDPNKPHKMSVQTNGTHDPLCGDPNKPQHTSAM